MGALLSEKGINAPTGTSGPSDAAMAIGSVRTVAVGMAIWGAPVLVAIILLGQQHVLIAIAAFFSKLAIVTFGGAYAVLAYMAQAAVTSQGWLTAGQMADGLGLAETTPGPLILVTQYVGFLAGWHAPAPFTPLLAGMLASVMTLWVTFVPCFIWIFAFAPWVERLEHARRLHAAMAAIAAAVVGVIANLSLWFALHVLFGRVHTDKWGIITTQAPEWSTFDGNAAVLATGAIIATLRYGRSPLVTILGTALASVAFSLLTF
jgi:chromate transporter